MAETARIGFVSSPERIGRRCLRKEEVTMALRKAGLVNFTQQVIFEYLLSNNDKIITEATDNLIEGGKAKGIASFRVEMQLGPRNQEANRQRINAASDWLEGPFRLYLAGHGDWIKMTLGGRNATKVALDFAAIRDCERCQLISILGCELALTPSATGEGTSTNSFAKEFHRLISNAGQEETLKKIPVYANTKTVSVSDSVMAALSVQMQSAGSTDPLRKVGSKSNNATKKVFYWQGGKQMMTSAAFAGMTMTGLSHLVQGTEA